MHDDAHVKSHLRGFIDRTPRTRTAANEDDALPSVGDGEYQAHGRAAAKPLFAIHFAEPDGSIRTFQYQHLMSDSRYRPGEIRLVFLAARPVAVTICGRNLRQLYDGLHRHVISWVMAAGEGRDFTDGDTALVTGIGFDDAWTPQA
jgi:hypothetical protein